MSMHLHFDLDLSGPESEDHVDEIAGAMEYNRAWMGGACWSLPAFAVLSSADNFLRWMAGFLDYHGGRAIRADIEDALSGVSDAGERANAVDLVLRVAARLGVLGEGPTGPTG